MIVSYSPLLVALSVLISVCGGYSCFHLVERLTHLYGMAWKTTLLLAAVAIGGGIWAMHFVGMLALHLPVAISYELQKTLLSALIAVGVTAVALYLVTLRSAPLLTTGLGGLLMGSGISGMHYVGMDAILGNCLVSYDHSLVALSIGVGIAASTMALYLALRVRNRWKQVPSAVAMGVAIAGMHYTAMFAASFSYPGEVVTIAQPALDKDTLAVVITVVAFILMGSSFFLAAPVPAGPRGKPSEETLPFPLAPAEVGAGNDRTSIATAGAGDEGTAAEIPLIPVQLGRQRTTVDANGVVCVQADAHYTKVCTPNEEFFCSLSMADMEQQLKPLGFLRVHRSHLVNLAHVKGFNPQKGHGDLIVTVAGKDRVIPVSRGKVEVVKAVLGAPPLLAG